MITDEKRRDVAERLRILASHAPADKDYVLDALGLYPGKYIDGFDQYCVNELADLIDRPTCEMTECSIDNGSRSWGMRCSRCGTEFEHEKPAYGWRYCPKCGAAIVDD